MTTNKALLPECDEEKQPAHHKPIDFQAGFEVTGDFRQFKQKYDTLSWAYRNPGISSSKFSPSSQYTRRPDLLCRDLNKNVLPFTSPLSPCEEWGQMHNCYLFLTVQDGYCVLWRVR